MSSIIIADTCTTYFKAWGGKDEENKLDKRFQAIHAGYELREEVAL